MTPGAGIDEPTVGLDPKSARLMKDILRPLVGRSGTAVILSTHILEIAENSATASASSTG
jgi:ABC-2 type transport system ATP-binding protein